MALKIFKDYKFAVAGKGTGFYVRSTGHYCVTPAMAESVHPAGYAEFFWCIGGQGLFRMNGKTSILNPGEVWYYPVGAVHDIRPSDPFFHYRWFTIEGPSAARICEDLRLKPGIHTCGEAPVDLFLKLEKNIDSLAPEDNREVLSAAFDLMTRIAAPCGGNTLPVSSARMARQIIDAEFGDPSLNINEVARQLHVHRVSLSRAFSEEYHIPVSGYLHACRVRKGLRLLSESPRSVKEIAEECGFASSGYFIKVIEKVTGKTPGVLAKENRKPRD